MYDDSSSWVERESDTLPAARGESLAAFDGRCIPAGCVAPPSNTPGILRPRALPSGRLARLGATPDFHHGLLSHLDWPQERTGRIHERPCGADAERTRRQEHPRAARRLEPVGGRRKSGDCKELTLLCH